MCSPSTSPMTGRSGPPLSGGDDDDDDDDVRCGVLVCRSGAAAFTYENIRQRCTKIENPNPNGPVSPQFMYVPLHPHMHASCMQHRVV
jgi:hypothetical protein